MRGCEVCLGKRGFRPPLGFQLAGRVGQRQECRAARVLGVSQKFCPYQHTLIPNAAGDIESYAAELSALLAARASALEALRLRLHRFRRLVSGLVVGAGGAQA